MSKKIIREDEINLDNKSLSSSSLLVNGNFSKTSNNNRSLSQTFENNDNDDDEESVDEEDFFYGTSVLNHPRNVEEIIGNVELGSQNWRTKERMKTVSVAVVMCLNVGIDPPDILKPVPSAVIQCWINPFLLATQKASDEIAKALLKQYERLQSRAKFRHLVDPTIEDVKKLCTSLRRNSKEERVLFHYNGHGVPRPTLNGEIWVFNRNFTQYIPLSIYDLQQWLGTPSIYVFDCSNAGIIVKKFEDFSLQHQKEYDMNLNSTSLVYSTKENDLLTQKISVPPRYQTCILLAACDHDETLPLHPDLPADLFTACLTTPIKTYLTWFVVHNPLRLSPNFTPDLIEKIPGQANDRKSVLGELHWIFTAVTDTIAWNTLPQELFQRLFRQDSLVASLFRNFLLAQRILHTLDCRPVSNPAIKSVHNHPMWKAWDLAAEHSLRQLFNNNGMISDPKPYVPSLFFTQQLTAFQIWLRSGSYPSSKPEQLPIVLQVLLSQVHRSRALDLLGNFLHLGPRAVNLALSVGIFPYVLKLLQASARELRPFLVFIWAKILAIDKSSQNELIRDNAHRYFMNVLVDPNISLSHQMMSVFVLSIMVRHNPNGQKLVTQNNSTNQYGSIINIASVLLMDETYNRNDNLRKWLIICLGNIWENNEEIRWLATRSAVYEKLYPMLSDAVPEVRAATVFALGTFINSISNRNEHANEIDRNIVSILLQKIFYDSSPLVRKELLVTLHWFIRNFENKFIPIVRKRIEYSENENSQSSVEQNNHDHLKSSNQNIPKNFSLSDFKKDASFQRYLSNNSNQIHLDRSSSKTNELISVTPPNRTNTLMKKVNSTSSLKIAAPHQASLTNIFDRVFQVIELYLLDPYPEVAQMALIIYQDIQKKAEPLDPNSSINHRHRYQSSNGELPNLNFGLSNDMEFNQRTLILKNHNHNNVAHHSGRVSVAGYSTPSYAVNQYTVKRKIFGKDPSLDGNMWNKGLELDHHENGLAASNDSSSSNQLINDNASCRKPLVNTSFVDWSTKQFCQPCSHHSEICCCDGNVNVLTESRFVNWNLLESKTKMIRQYKKFASKLNSSFTIRQQIPVGRLKQNQTQYALFHPFEKFLVLTDDYTNTVWDYSENSKKPTLSFDNIFATMTNSQNFFQSGSDCRITDLQLLNTHEKTLLMVASDDGSIRVWQNAFSYHESFYSDAQQIEVSEPSKPKLCTGFFIFDDMPLLSSINQSRRRILLAWNQNKQRLIAGGQNKFIRLWDANEEKKIRDILTGSEVVTSLNNDYRHEICVGSQDGVVRVFDDRVSNNDGRIISFAGTVDTVINAKIWPESHSNPIHIVSGHCSGEIRWYDRRFTTKAVRTESNGDRKPMKAMSFQNQADMFACLFGDEDVYDIQLYTMDALKAAQIKIRNQFVRNIVYHPFKEKIAVINDANVSIYQSSGILSSLSFDYT